MVRSDLTPTQLLSSLPVVGGGLKLLERLGAGGMAEVFLASRGDERVVVKRMLPHLTEPQYKSMFLREAAIGARVVHPHVVRTIELIEDTGGPMLVLEYVDGWTLRNIARTAWHAQAAIPQPVLFRIMMDVCDGLAAIHSTTDEHGNPFVHRDISPDNLMLGRDGITKVLDFGVASPGEDMPLTRTGELRGKIAYMPPEQLQARPVDGRADLYALGVTFFWMLCGRRPFADRSELALMQRIVSEPAPRLSGRLKTIDPAIDRIIAKLLEKNREQRFVTASALSAALVDVGVADRAAVMAFVEDIAQHAQGGDPVTTSSTADSPTQVSRPLRAKRSHAVVALDDASEWQGEDAPMAITPTAKAPIHRRVMWVAAASAMVVFAVVGWVVSNRTGASEQQVDTDLTTSTPTVVEMIPVPLPSAPVVAPVVAPVQQVIERTEAVPLLPSTKSVVIIGAPDSVHWRAPHNDKDLGHGSATFELPIDTKVVHGRIAELDGVVDVAISANNTIDWSALPRGDLSVRSLSQVSVFIGSRSFGTTPREDIPLVAGRYPVRIVHGDGREELRSVEVTVGRVVLKIAP
jgi:serine/threonine protein kinase